MIDGITGPSCVRVNGTARYDFTFRAPAAPNRIIGTRVSGSLVTPTNPWETRWSAAAAPREDRFAYMLWSAKPRRNEVGTAIHRRAGQIRTADVRRRNGPGVESERSGECGASSSSARSSALLWRAALASSESKTSASGLLALLGGRRASPSRLRGSFVVGGAHATR